MKLTQEDLALQKILLHHIKSTEIWLNHAETSLYSKTPIAELKNKLIEAIKRVREFNLKHGLDTFAGLLD